jgi:predicted RNA-binding Zn-ribbon protein involved in translation (DUF1610 family)
MQDWPSGHKEEEMPESTFAKSGDTILKCEQCDTHDKVVAAYNCTSCDNHVELGPEPDGLPVTRPCPGCGMDIAGKIIRCDSCGFGSD